MYYQGFLPPSQTRRGGAPRAGARSRVGGHDFPSRPTAPGTISWMKVRRLLSPIGPTTPLQGAIAPTKNVSGTPATPPLIRDPPPKSRPPALIRHLVARTEVAGIWLRVHTPLSEEGPRSAES